MDANKVPGVLRVIVGSDSVGTQQDTGKAMTLPRSGVTVRWGDGNGNTCKARASTLTDVAIPLETHLIARADDRSTRSRVFRRIVQGLAPSP
jgi:hypothetical protein